NRLTHIMTFRKSAAVNPCQLVAYLEPAVLNGHSEPVVRAGSGERNDMAARFQHAHDLFPELDRKGHLARIPRLTHEARRGPCISVITLSGRCVRSAESLYDGNQSIGGIANHAIHAIIWHLGQHVPAV